VYPYKKKKKVYIKFEDSKGVIRGPLGHDSRRTDKTMVKRKGTKRQTIVYGQYL
jgi:hypothetical protein